MLRRLTGLLLLFLVSASLAQAQSYTLVDLGAFTPARISANGAVVGTLRAPVEAAQVAPDGTLALLGFLPSQPGLLCEDSCQPFSQGADTSGAQAVGWSSTGVSGRQVHAWIGNSATGLEDLGSRPEAPEGYSAATAVNSVGTVAGHASRPDQTSGPVIWVGSQLSDLPTLGGAGGFPSAMFENGDIVGECQLASSAFHACLWPVTGGVLDLDTLGGTTSWARGIAGSLAIVGEVLLPGLGRRGFVWLPWAGMQALPVLPGEAFCTASGGSSTTGWIVGQCGHTNDLALLLLQQATYWDGGAQPHPLAEVVTLPDGWTLLNASAMNEANQIVGLAQVGSAVHGFRLDPVAAVAQLADPPPVRLAKGPQRHR